MDTYDRADPIYPFLGDNKRVHSQSHCIWLNQAHVYSMLSAIFVILSCSRDSLPSFKVDVTQCPDSISQLQIILHIS